MGLFDFLKKDPTVENYQMILKECNQAIALNDKDPALWNKKCLVLRTLGSIDEAINAGKIGVQLAPNDPDLWDSLRLAYLHSDGNQEKADECQKHVSDLIKQEKERLKQERAGKECSSCGMYYLGNVRCINCGKIFCPNCYPKHLDGRHGVPRIKDYY